MKPINKASMKDTVAAHRSVTASRQLSKSLRKTSAALARMHQQMVQAYTPKRCSLWLSTPQEE